MEDLFGAFLPWHFFFPCLFFFSWRFLLKSPWSIWEISLVLFGSQLLGAFLAKSSLALFGLKVPWHVFGLKALWHLTLFTSLVQFLLGVRDAFLLGIFSWWSWWRFSLFNLRGAFLLLTLTFFIVDIIVLGAFLPLTLDVFYSNISLALFLGLYRYRFLG